MSTNNIPTDNESYSYKSEKVYEINEKSSAYTQFQYQGDFTADYDIADYIKPIRVVRLG